MELFKCFKDDTKPKTLSPPLKKIKKELKKKAQKNGAGSNHLSASERKLIQEIQNQTERHNRNNITRTRAYLDFYEKYPDIHWAFLGHMVSRNGGWNMTDLKGELLQELLTEDEQNDFFNFIERGNWLIFQDVYPQLLIYEESIKQKTPLFHLLPHFDVSVFMETIWEDFWKRKDRYLLAIAMVINEQSYLEKRVIQNPYYQDTVLHTIEFKLQDFLSTNHILFPYFDGDRQRVRVKGQTLHHFSSLHERILLGKRLYHVLFHDRDQYQAFFEWARSTPHTGSRKDFWPHLFHDVRESVPGMIYKPRINHCTITGQSPRLYSPVLSNAWKDQSHQEAEIGDWYSDWKVLDYLQERPIEVSDDVEEKYCETLEWLEFAIFTKQFILHQA